MALVSVSSKCFNAVEAALTAVKAGDAKKSTAILQSISQDGLLLQKAALSFCERLKQKEQQQQLHVEELTRQMTDLYREERKLEDTKRELEIKKTTLNASKEQHQQSKRDAQRRYSEAKDKQREAEQKLYEFKTNCWKPIVGQVLLVRELIENNSAVANTAYRDADRHDNDASNAQRRIDETNTAVEKANDKINTLTSKIRKLKVEQEECHKELGDVRKMTSFVMQAVAFWEDLISICKAATINTDHLQRIVGLAAEKKNTVHILRSRGTKSLARSFKDCWMEIVETLNSTEPHALVFVEEMLALDQSTSGDISRLFPSTDSRGWLVVAVLVCAMAMILMKYSKVFYFLTVVFHIIGFLCLLLKVIEYRRYNSQ